MRCIDRQPQPAPPRPWLRLVSLASLLLSTWLVGCGSNRPVVEPTPPQPATPAPSPLLLPRTAPAAPVPAPLLPAPAPLTSLTSRPPLAPAQAPARNSSAVPAKPKATPRFVNLPEPAAPSSIEDLKQQFARRLVQSHPDTSYLSRAPERLLAIPVIEVELNADGSVRNLVVLRRPSTGNEATALALDAIRRAGPYGSVAKLPRPWKIVEAFLFDDELRFKPRTLDLD